MLSNKYEELKNKLSRELNENSFFKVNDIIKDKNGVLGKIEEIDESNQDKPYVVLFQDIDSEKGRWWCSKDELFLTTEEEKKNFENWYNNNFYKEEKAEVKEDKTPLQDIYNTLIKEGLDTTSNGNYIFSLKKFNLSEREEKLFDTMIRNDIRIIDTEYNNKTKEYDIIFELDYCTNLDLGQDEIEAMEEDEMD